jgi:hypothetical protein
MPLINGRITQGWAIVDVLVAVSQPRRQLLVRNGFPIPQHVHVRALLDTGAYASGFAPRVFQELDLTPVSTEMVYTPSTSPTSPHKCDLYDVSLSLVANGGAHPFPDTRVMAADCWLPGEGLEALIGMDILCGCNFQLWGPEKQFVLSF